VSASFPKPRFAGMTLSLTRSDLSVLIRIGERIGDLALTESPTHS
jgi:hypothetical protein